MELSMRAESGIKPLNQMTVEDIENLAVKMLAKTQRKAK